MSSLDDPFDQANVYVPAGVIVRFIEPVGLMHDVSLVMKDEMEKFELLFGTANWAVAEHPLPSVTVTS